MFKPGRTSGNLPNSAVLLAAAVLAVAGSGPALACAPEALGTARTMAVGTSDGLEVGAKSYPRSLALGPREVVLTFDDGPLPATTTRILNALRRECVRATFFVIGRNARANPRLVRRIVSEGHTLAHHSYSHPARTLRRMPLAAAKADILRGISATEQAAYGSSGARPRVPFFRFPGFADSRALNNWLAGRNIGIFGTDLWASDWARRSPAAQQALTMRRLNRRGRGMILFHDTSPVTAAMLPGFLRALKRGGYRVVHIVPGSGRARTAGGGRRWRSQTEAIIAGMNRRRPRARARR